MGYPQQQAYYPPPQAGPRGSQALALISAVVGLGLAGVLTWQPLDLLDNLGSVTEWMPAGWTAAIVVSFVVALVALVGAVLVFARLIAGAFILVVAGVLAIGATVMTPMVAADIGITMVDAPPTAIGKELYFQQLFSFATTQGTLRLVALALGVVLLIIAVLPPSLNWLKGSRRDGYSAQQPGW